MVGYLMMLSVSRQYNADDMIINEYRANGGTKMCRDSEKTYHSATFPSKKSHMT